MDQSTCARCGKQGAEHFFRFAVVSSNEEKSYSTELQGIQKVEKTTTTTTESFRGVESIRVCEDCIKKQRASSARAWGLGGFLVVLVGGFVINFILSIFIFPEKQSYRTNYGLYALISLGVALVAGVLIGLLLRSTQLDTETPFIAAKVYAKLPDVYNTYNYVPLVPEIYTRKGETEPDPVLFKGKNHLETDLADTLFLRYIKSGR